jgi:serine O-acetyltransferase
MGREAPDEAELIGGKRLAARREEDRQHTDALALRGERYRQHTLDPGLGGLLAEAETLVGMDVRNEERLTGEKHLAGETALQRQSTADELVRAPASVSCHLQDPPLRIELEDRSRACAEEFADAVKDRLADGADVRREGERAGRFQKAGELAVAGVQAFGRMGELAEDSAVAAPVAAAVEAWPASADGVWQRDRFDETAPTGLRLNALQFSLAALVTGDHPFDARLPGRDGTDGRGELRASVPNVHEGDDEGLALCRRERLIPAADSRDRKACPLENRGERGTVVLVRIDHEDARWLDFHAAAILGGCLHGHKNAPTVQDDRRRVESLHGSHRGLPPHMAYFERKTRVLGEIVDDLLNTYSSDQGEDVTPRGPSGEALPGRQEVIDLVDHFDALFFPGYRRAWPEGPAPLEEKLVILLDRTYDLLHRLVLKVLPMRWWREDNPTEPLSVEQTEDVAQQIVRDALHQTPRLREILRRDVDAGYDGDPSARSYAEVILSYPYLHALSAQRVAHVLYDLDVPVLPRFMTEYLHSLTGIDMHPGARIGERLFIDHGHGVVIGETCVIGDRVKLYQGVTLGARSFTLDDRGIVTKGGKRHPTIEDDVVIYSHATILGGETVVGRGSIIGGNVWLTHSVPPHSVVQQSISAGQEVRPRRTAERNGQPALPIGADSGR